jgi:hypothetical protein
VTIGVKISRDESKSQKRIVATTAIIIMVVAIILSSINVFFSLQFSHIVII